MVSWFHLSVRDGATCHVSSTASFVGPQKRAEATEGHLADGSFFLLLNFTEQKLKLPLEVAASDRWHCLVILDIPTKGGSEKLGDFLPKDSPVAVPELSCGAECPLEGCHWIPVVTGRWFHPITVHVSLHWVEKNHRGSKHFLVLKLIFIEFCLFFIILGKIIWIFLAWFPQL